MQWENFSKNKTKKKSRKNIQNKCTPINFKLNFSKTNSIKGKMQRLIATDILLTIVHQKM